MLVMACKESKIEVINVTRQLYKCTLCLKVFELEIEVENHIENEHSIPVRTILTGDKFKDGSVTDSGTSEKPANAQENVTYKCEICQEECHSLRYLNAHTIVEHENATNRHKCDACSAEFNSARLLFAHKIVVHEGKWNHSDTKEDEADVQENGIEQVDESKPETFSEDSFHVNFNGSNNVENSDCFVEKDEEEIIDENVKNQLKITSVSSSKLVLKNSHNDLLKRERSVALVHMKCERVASTVTSQHLNDMKNSVSEVNMELLDSPVTKRVDIQSTPQSTKTYVMVLRRNKPRTSTTNVSESSQKLNNKISENKSRLDNTVQVSRNVKKKYSNLHSSTGKKRSTELSVRKSKRREKYSFSDQSTVKYSLSDQHSKGPYSCGICGLEVTMQCALRKHLTSHRERILAIDRKCHVCSEKFDTVKLLKTHMNKEHIGEKVFKCKNCPKSFNWKGSLLDHVKRLHEKEKLHYCSVCNKGFVRKSYLEIHEMVHKSGVTSLRKGYKRHYCDVCSKSFSSSSSYKAHRRIHTREKPFSCLYCDKKFVTKQLCKDHMYSHTNNYPYHCDVCGKLFTRPGQLATHKEKHDGKIDSNRSYKCDFCDKSFTSSSTLRAHRRVHTGEKPFDCLYCGKKFVTKRGCSDHMTIHTNEKPHKCEECNKAFLRPGQLTIHKEIHKGGNPFTCETCGMSFPTQGGLKYHFKKHDPNFKPDSTECHFCGKSFVHIDLHIKTVHTGEKDFICEVCGKAFAGKNGLKKHMETHSGAKPFQCEICCRSFLRNTAMMRHMTIHSEEKPYVCEICDKSFHRKDTLTSHQKVHFKNIIQYAAKL